MKKEVFFEFINEWTQFSKGWNWRTFHPFMIEVEEDRCMGGFEATFIFMLVGFRVRVNYVETNTTEEINKALEDLKETLEIDKASYETMKQER